jgi:hypothetical protein
MFVGVYGVNQGVWNGSYVDRHGLAEQQAVLLQYQQDNLQHFRKEILHLQESLSKYERMQDGSTPQVQTCDPAMVSFNQASAQVWHRLGTALRIMLGGVLQSHVPISRCETEFKSHLCICVCILQFWFSV